MNTRQEDIFYQAMLTRDARFDGKFFVGVKTTGIYCRPICPAKPKRNNIEFYSSALLAEKNGYRPCMRCRPESAPLSAVWIGRTAIVKRALKVISSETISSEEEFANRFGVSARHLRRLFVQEVGLTPKQVFDHHRLNFSRKLVLETRLPLSQIAFISNFKSLRRFNDAFKNKYKASPTQMRQKGSVKKSHLIKLNLSYRPPFDWQGLLAFFKAHEVFGVDAVSEGKYTRNFEIDGKVGTIVVSNDNEKSCLVLEVHCEDTSILYTIVSRVRRMFDLDSDPLLVASVFKRHRVLSKLYNKYPGIRVPQAWDPYETAICTVLGQLVSLKQTRNLIQQLVTTYGRKLDEGYIFPSAQKLARAKFQNVATTGKRKETLRKFSKLIVNNKASLNTQQDMGEFKKSILEIAGIGPWSAEYICLRAMGDTDAFPASDLILKRALELHKDLDIEVFRPWRSYVAMYLWREYAESLSKVKK